MIFQSTHASSGTLHYVPPPHTHKYGMYYWIFWYATFIRLLLDSPLFLSLPFFHTLCFYPCVWANLSFLPFVSSKFQDDLSLYICWIWWLFMHGTFSQNNENSIAQSSTTEKQEGLQSFFGWNIFNGLVCILAMVINVQHSRIIKFPP